MKHIPNILSCFRIVLIIPFLFTINEGNIYIAGTILLISAITDVADGFIARKFNFITDLGKILDPAADKLTQVAVCVALSSFVPEFTMFFTIIIIKEILMLISSAILLLKGSKPIQAKWYGKVATVCFYVTTISMVYFENMSLMIIGTLAFITIVFIILSFVKYMLVVKKDIGNT